MVSKVASSSSSSAAMTSISTHELALTSPPSSTAFSPNSLIPLIALCRHPSPEIVHKAVYAAYRVFTKLAGDGRLFATGEKGDGREEVARWIRERLEEYLEALCGLMRDSEPDLRKSSISIYISILPPISIALTDHLSSTPLLSLPHVRHLLLSLLYARPSPRGGKLVTASPFDSKWDPKEENQWKLAPESTVDGVKVDERIPDEVKEEVVQKLVDNDDLRWAFFKELSALLEHLNNPASTSSKYESLPPPSNTLSSNILALQLPLQNLPKELGDINTFWCPHVGIRPSKKIKLNPDGSAAKGKKAKIAPKGKGKKADGAEDRQDWLAFYDSSSEESESEDEETGSKRKRRSGISKKSQHAMIHSPSSHRSLFTRSYLGLISLPLSQTDTRSILLLLHASILPNMTKSKVVRLTDWLGGLVDEGGALALLALNGLYVLIRDYNLEYPGFYRRLYGLMDREVMHVKYRARFFRLSDTFLASPLLPAALVASFIKRLAQLSLTSPPAAIIMIIPFVYNLLKRHPACMMMLQGPDTDEDEEVEPRSGGKSVDPYDSTEMDPARTGALDSSLWELKSLQRHYLSHVATMAKLFGEVFTKPEFLLEDFLDHGYTSLSQTEMGRKIRSDPALNIEVVRNPFPAKRADADPEEAYRPEEQDLVADLWTFGQPI